MQNERPDNGRAAGIRRLPFDEDLPTTLARIEREMILAALEATGGNKAGAARALGISERLMGLRVKKHAIDPRKFRTRR